MAAPSMNAIADRYRDQGVGSIFLYTHEAHPGEYYPHHTSMEQKLWHARDLCDKLGVTRPILVDALDGACHRAYGSFRNQDQDAFYQGLERNGPKAVREYRAAFG